MSKSKIYNTPNGDDKNQKGVSESSFMKNGTTAEITIGDKKFKIIGPRDTIEIQRIIKTQSIFINRLENENITIRRTLSKLQLEIQELKNIISKVNTRYFGDEN